MKTRRILTASLCASLLLAGAALAQRHAGNPQGMVDHLATALDLTDAQKATATQLHAVLQAKSAPLLQQSKQQWTEMRALLESPNPDATEIGGKMIAAHGIQTQLKALHDEFHANLSAILNADQKAKLAQLDQRRWSGRPASPGAPGSPDSDR